MDRRTLIKNLALAVGGAVLLPSCLHPDGTTYIKLKHINIDADQEKLITDMCETLIPKTNTPGAKDLHLPAFVLKMIDDCYGKKDQQAFLAGLRKFTEMVKTKHNSSFSDLSVKDREAVLIDIENSAKPKDGAKAPARKPRPQKHLQADPLMAFYWAIKQQTIFAYTTSQYFMTKLVFYDMVPGRYNVHYPVSKLKLA
ncbi:gluconate 2-dehydrogenase subunit 3 family protein [Mucilaginibacter sp.]|uniref:gluconate 2-dehydrogenase subunit 3 family protein n=1 Tax=Mucilaginibacter sp. TaxID=1882438 RepID=UPI0028463E9B|nr:gluconate 2-dehydrogenase subunit 3 family protein [Mucilaginibacter sp.]MDR3697358.1 gluconate 2-dehydrogenase subunit 3 family protein [Mucilaginibacter sp.]